MKVIGYLILGGLSTLGIVALPATLGSMMETVLRIRTEVLEKQAYHRFLATVNPEDYRAYQAEVSAQALRQYQGPVQ